MFYKISVIVPVYNSEKYLQKTLDSLCMQSIFEDLEIVVINDGSKDKSLKICKEYEEKYSNIKVFSQNNAGVSNARNKGIELAQGRYITFLDSDDIVESNLYELEYNLIESNNSDIAIVDFIKQHPNGVEVKYRSNYTLRWDNNNEALKAFFSGIIGGQVVDKIFDSKIIKKIYFPENYKIGEDMSFVYQSILKSKKIIMDTNISGYKYIVRESSAMTGRFQKKHFDPYKISKQMYDESYDNVGVRKYAQAHLIHETCKVLEYIYRSSADKKYVKEVNDMRSQLKNYSIKDAKQFLIKKQFYGFLLMRFSPKLYLKIHKMMHIG